MIGTQLDLFGGTPKPPKKITIDEEPEQIEKSQETAPMDKETPVLKASDELEEDGAIHVQMPTENSFSTLEVIEVVPETETKPEVEVETADNETEYVAETDEGIIENAPTETNESPQVQENITEEAIETDFPIVASEPADVIKIHAVADDEGHEQIQEEEAHQNIVDLHEDDGVELVAVHENMNVSIEDHQLNVPDDQILFSRQYYTMRETSAMFNVNQSLLRFWENEFDVLKPKKNRKGDRYFRPEDIKNLVLIYHLLRVRKFTINGAKDYLKSRSKVLDTFEMVQRLEKLKAFLVEMKANL